jgi:hypothetical protein
MKIKKNGNTRKDSDKKPQTDAAPQRTQETAMLSGRQWAFKKCVLRRRERDPCESRTMGRRQADMSRDRIAALSADDLESDPLGASSRRPLEVMPGRQLP